MLNGLAFNGFQISDSLGWWLCSNNLIDMGTFGSKYIAGEWCQRRAIYPTFLSGIMLLAQKNIFMTLFLQSLIVSTAIFLAVRRCVSIFGWLGALISTGLLYFYAVVNLFTLTMTENAGLIFGCAGWAMMILAASKKSTPWMAFGIAFVAVALNARAGAFFVLPFLVLWAGAAAYLLGESVLRWIGVSIFAILTGFLLQALLVFAVGGDPSNSHGNFSYTLYGLSVGGKGWSQVLVDHPEVTGSDGQMSKAIYALAWSNISHQPLLFLQGLKINFYLFISKGTYGFESLGHFSFLFKAAWWLAWIPLLVNRKNPVYLLIGLSSIGVVLSALFLLVDGGSRIFAATVVVDAVQMAVGLSWIGLTVTRGVVWRKVPVTAVIPTKVPLTSGIPVEIIFSIFLLLMLLIPHISLKNQQYDKPVYVTHCANNEDMMIVRIGAGTMLLDIVEGGNPVSFIKGEVNRDIFFSQVLPSYWWSAQMKNFTGKSLLVTREQNSPLKAVAPLFYADQHLARFSGHTVRACIDKLESQIVFDNTYRKLNSITALD